MSRRSIVYMDGTAVREMTVSGSEDVAKRARRLAAAGSVILKVTRI